MLQHVVVVFSAQWAFSIFELNIYNDIRDKLTRSIERCRYQATGSEEVKVACTHTGLLPESDPASVVEFFTRTSITTAGGQFDFERCTRKMFVQVNTVYVSYRLRYLKQSSGTDRFRHVCTFQCSYIETDKPAVGPARGLASSSPAR